MYREFEENARKASEENGGTGVSAEDSSDTDGEKFTRLNIVAAKISFLGKASGSPPQLERTSKPKMEPIMESNPFDEV